MTSAIIVGSSGAVGQELLFQIIKNRPNCKVYAPVRSARKTEQPSSHNIHREKGEVANPSDFSFPNSDVLFICIGTTQKKTPDKEQYKTIDVDIPIAWARWAKETGVPKVIVISSLGANSRSSFFYNRIKGEMEEGVSAHNPGGTTMVRPSLLMGKREENRVGEKIAIWLYNFLGFLIPKNYKGVTYQTVARSMMALAESSDSPSTVESMDLAAWADSLNQEK